MKQLSLSFCILLFSLLFCLGITIFSLPDHTFSDNENRMLKTKADLSHDVISGKFQNDLEDFLCDQFPCRDALVTWQTRLKYWTGRQDIGGVYIAADRLFQKITDTDVSLKTIGEHVARYARMGKRANDIPVTAIPVPSAGTVNSSQLPQGADMYRFDLVLKTVDENIQGTVIDLRKEFLDNPTYFYKTDHHWTAAGAYRAYTAWCYVHNITPFSLDDFTLADAPEAFFGTLSSKAPGIITAGDIFQFPTVSPLTTVNADGNAIPFYDFDALTAKDKYRFFLCGNHGITTIENPTCSNGNTIVIIKDSFANCMVPYLVPHYKTIVLIDERYAVTDAAALAVDIGANEIAIIKEAAYF